MPLDITLSQMATERSVGLIPFGTGQLRPARRPSDRAPDGCCKGDTVSLKAVPETRISKFVTSAPTRSLSRDSARLAPRYRLRRVPAGEGRRVTAHYVYREAGSDTRQWMQSSHASTCVFKLVAPASVGGYRESRRMHAHTRARVVTRNRAEEGRAGTGAGATL